MTKIVEMYSERVTIEELQKEDGGMGFALDFEEPYPGQTELGCIVVSYLNENDNDLMGIVASGYSHNMTNEEDTQYMFNFHKTLKSVEGKRLKLTIEVLDE